MDSYDWLKEFCSFYMAVIIGSERGLRIKVHHRNQPNRNKAVNFTLTVVLNSYT